MSAARHATPAEPGPARRQGRVFAIGVGAMAATVLVAAGFTWASQGGGTESEGVLTASPQAAATAAARAKAGECAMVVDGRPQPVPLATARTMTMVAAVGQQVRSPDVQTARAIDAALAKPGAAAPKVTDALGLLARDYPQAPDPATLARLRALSTPGALTCAHAEAKAKKEKPGSSGLTPRAGALRASLIDAFGNLKIDGYNRPGVKDPRPADAAAAAGRAFDVSLAPVSDETRTRGWVLAHWLVAAGSAHHVAAVTYDGWRWTSAPGAGWHQLPPPLRAPDPAVTPAPTAPSEAEVARSVAARYYDRLHVAVTTGR